MRVLKWSVILLGGAAAAVILLLLLAPYFLDAQKYRTAIERHASEALGAPVSLEGEMSLSLFPSAGIRLSGLRVGNPSGFREKDLLYVRAFHVEVRLLPLLSRELRIERFVLEGPRLVLEKSETGKGNWEALGRPDKSAPPGTAKEPEALPVRRLDADELAVRDGSVLYIDRAAKTRRELTGLGLILKDLSFDRPIGIDFSADTREGTIFVSGLLGPLGPVPGKGAVPFDLTGKAFKSLEANIKGKIEPTASVTRVRAEFRISPFSPRGLLDALKIRSAAIPEDPETFSRFSLSGTLAADPDTVEISDGRMELDRSKAVFSARISEFSKPAIALDFSLDEIDLDRYLPPAVETAPSPEASKQAPPPPPEAKTDYGALRSLVLEAGVRVGKLKAKGARLEELNLKLSGKNGELGLKPAVVKLYKGTLQGEANIDLRSELPKSSIRLKAIGIEANPFLRDLMNRDILEGTGSAELSIRAVGDTGAAIRKSLNGEGNFRFSDGAVKGIDLAAMVRNVEAALGLAEKGGERPRTDFSELRVPFVIRDGVADISGSSLASPFLRLAAGGKADLAKEILDIRVEPKLVTTIKGQGDVQERSGLTVPVLITGSFTDPKFRPDVKSILRQRIGERLPPGVKEEAEKLLESGEKPSADRVQDLLKKLPFGR